MRAAREPLLRLLDRTLVGDGCWEFAGKPSSEGYSGVRVKQPRSRFLYGHRLTYEAFIAPIPDGHQVHHKCGNRICVRPDHLGVMSIEDHARHHAMPRLPTCKVCGAEDWKMRSDGGRECGSCKTRRAYDYHRSRDFSALPRCSVAGCEQYRHSRGWCGTHYQRWRKTGDPLTPDRRFR